jgi:hypothetical protein
LVVDKDSVDSPSSAKYNITVIKAEYSEEAEMRSVRLRIVTVAAGAAVLLFASAALAQVKETGGGEGDGYGYQFDDDPLAAGGFGPNDATIKVRPKAARTTLIRPRTSFMPEMIKSVENI